MAKKILITLVLVSLLLSGCGKGSSTGSTAGSQAASDLSGALNLVLGSTDNPSVFSSYHMELTLDTPVLGDDGVTVTNETTQISADVAGSSIHIVQLDPGATATKEGYIIGETEYKMVDGARQETNGMIALGWAMWPLKVVIPYAWSVNWAEKTGTDTIDGRSADVYTFDSANAPADVQAYMNAADTTGTTTASGTVWIDQETGAMLKLDMTYGENLSDNDGKVVGTGTGTIKLELSKVNQTTVVEP